jgi:hypothetical protein
VENVPNENEDTSIPAWARFSTDDDDDRIGHASWKNHGHEKNIRKEREEHTSLPAWAVTIE